MTQTIRTLYLVLQDGRRFVLNKAQSGEFIDNVSRRIAGQSPRAVIGKTPRPLRKRGGEPVYEGRKLSEWIRSLNTDDARRRHEAATALGQIGGPALPALIDAFSSDSQNVREVALGATNSMLISRKLARAGKLELIPILAKMLADSRESALARASCASGLGAIGPDASGAVSSLRVVIASEDPYLRVKCAAALPAIDPGMSRTALPVLLESLRDEQSYIRAEAIAGLGRIGPSVDEALLAVAGALKDEDRACRRCAASALREMGAGASKAIEELKAALEDEDMLVRDAAADALERIKQEKDS
jgi:HEAT repeat protein